MYTSAVVGAGSVVEMNDNARLDLETDSNIGDLATVFSSGFTVRLTPQSTQADPRTSMKISMVFQSLQDLTDQEGFIGILNQTTALTAIPTIVKGLGLFWDLSVSPNYFFTFADGTTQDTTDTTVAVGGTPKRIDITWRKNIDQTIEFFENDDDTVPSATINSTRNVGVFGLLHAIVEAEDGAVKELALHEWIV